jgi:hypothetical protein
MVRLVCAALFLSLLAACGGSQETPPLSQASDVAPGYLRVTVHVAGKLDFTKYQYVLVFNTSGNGLTPEAGEKPNWNAYSAALDFAQAKGTSWVQVVQYLKGQDPHAPPIQERLAVTPSELQFAPNSDGEGTAFAVTFERSIFAANSVSIASRWRFNAFVFARGTVVDTMGRCDSCFKSPALPVNAAFDLSVPAQKPRSSVPASARLLAAGFKNDP